MDKRMPYEPIGNLSIGSIIEIDGTRIVAELHPALYELSRVYAGEVYPIGQFGSILKIHFGRRALYSFVNRLRMKADFLIERGIYSPTMSDRRVVEADLFGEGEWTEDENGWKLNFERGISTFPLPTQEIYLTPKLELNQIYGQRQEQKFTLQFGYYVGSVNLPCFLNVNELLGKHTAIVGSTGSGKSAAVAAILHSILDMKQQSGIKNWNPRIIVLDPHNEYSSAFLGNKLSTDDGSLKLPYWLLSFKEMCSLVIGKTEYVATSQTNIIKKAMLKAREEGCDILSLDKSKITIDSPIPYKIDTLASCIDADKPSQPSKQDPYISILHKLEILRSDVRLNFLMEEWERKDSDPIGSVFSQMLNSKDQPIIVDLSGVPNEVAGIASSVIARSLFSLKVWQTPEERDNDPVVLVCEEAHRYVPNRGDAQYEEAQEAIRRIAKEGRKYGIGLLLVSQRPSEVEATVLSQCNSWIVLRITNDRDREHVRSILPDSLSGLTKLLSGLKRQEAIVAGEAAIIPSRIMIRNLEADQLPQSHDVNYGKGWQNAYLTEYEITMVCKRWRYQENA